MKNNSNNFNLAGEFYVLSRLLLRGYNASLTLGNTKEVDILVSNPKNNLMFNVEVKTSNIKLQNNSAIWGKNFFKWPHMKEGHQRCANDKLIFCFVNFSDEDKPRMWIIHSKEVEKYIKWEHNFWVNSEHKKEIKDGSMRTLRIHLNNENSNEGSIILTSEKYENDFSIFESIEEQKLTDAGRIARL